MSGHKLAKKSGSKSKKDSIDKAEFDRVISDLSKEKEFFRTPPQQKLLFLLSGVYVSASPLFLYFTSVLEGNFLVPTKSNYLAFLIACLIIGVSSMILSYTYDILATKKRNHLILSKKTMELEKNKSGQSVKGLMARESAYYALLFTNIYYIALFLFFIGQFSPFADLNSPIIKFSLSTLLAGISCLFIAKLSTASLK